MEQTCPNDDNYHDELTFNPENASRKSGEGKAPWKVIISDDDKEVHDVTRLVLSDFTFEGRPIEFFNAYSGDETRALINTHPDCALILLDVVMERENAGLDVVRYIRDELKNHFVRIVLRTGQPGQAPEKEVIATYDINDYKEKTELTAQKLYTTVTTALRTYKHLRAIDRSRKGFECIVHASQDLFCLHSMDEFMAGVLSQLVSLMSCTRSSLLSGMESFIAKKDKGDFFVTAVSDFFEDKKGMRVSEFMPQGIQEHIQAATERKQSAFFDDYYIGYFGGQDDISYVLFLRFSHPLHRLEKNIITTFSTHMSIAFDNMNLNQEILETQKEITFTLGEVIERRSEETANHVRRVSEYSKLLAKKLGLSKEEQKIIQLASPMHDVGKIGIPDAILNKPGKLTTEEFEVMKTHTTIGYDILKVSKRPILKAAAIIALEHHEKWSGAGYPQGQKEEDIHIYGRIVAIADVFDALSHPRIYKEAWKLEDVFQLIHDERGKHFDPTLVDLFFAFREEIITIFNLYPDPPA